MFVIKSARDYTRLHETIRHYTILYNTKLDYTTLYETVLDYTKQRTNNLHTFSGTLSRYWERGRCYQTYQGTAVNDMRRRAIAYYYRNLSRREVIYGPHPRLPPWEN